jgi:hypothetical protein
MGGVANNIGRGLVPIGALVTPSADATVPGVGGEPWNMPCTTLAPSC